MTQYPSGVSKRIPLFVWAFLLVFVLAACGDVPPAETVPGDTQPGASTPGAADAPAPVSPLAAESPLAMPEVAPLPENYARPDRPYLLFTSSRNDARGWHLLDLEDDSVTPFPLDRLEDYQVNSLNWISDLGLFIAQLTDARNHTNLYLIDFDGELVAQITFDPYEAGNADYSPVTGMFAYVCLQQDLDVCVAAPNDPNSLNITAMNTREAGPRWSPDGKTVLYVSNASGVVNVWAVNPDGTNLRNLSEVGLGASLREEGDASWSPDGSTIVFRSHADGNPNIYIMDADGGNRRNLTDSPANDANPIWSPDGAYIAFRSNRDGGQDIYVLEVETGDLVNVSNSPDTRENNFIWSGDGEQLYFDSLVGDVFDIFVVNRDGTDVRNLTNSPDDDLDPQWVE